MINFDRLPTTNPFKLPDPGIYRAKVDKAQMTNSKTPGKPPYLAVTYILMDRNERQVGKVFDNLVDSDHQAVLYKIGRLCHALDLNLSGSLSLNDLAKLIVGKKLLMEIAHEADSRDPDNREKDRAKPKLFGSEVFWPYDMAREIIMDDEDLPFDIVDAAPETINTQEPIDTTDELDLNALAEDDDY